MLSTIWCICDKCATTQTLHVREKVVKIMKWNSDQQKKNLDLAVGDFIANQLRNYAS